LRDDFQARDKLKVSKVEAGDIEPKSRSRDPDDEVLEWDCYTFGPLFAFDASDHSGHLDGNGMHRHIAAQPVDESESALPVRFRFCAIYIVDQLGDSDDREADFNFAITGLYLFEDLPDGVTSTLGGDHNT
jgi:hypothetical protein